MNPLRESRAKLFQLIRDARAGEMSVEIYVLNYSAITEALVKHKAMTEFQRSLWILQGLSDDLRWKVFECGSEMGWRMLMDDMPMMTDPEFEDVKKMVLQKSRTAIRWKRYLSEQPDMELSGYDGWPSTSTTISTIPTAFPMSTLSNSLKELSEQISKLTLSLKNQSQQ
jgi:hypothetical protein